MKIFYTTGFAGTGKSTELLSLVPELPNTSVILAPTHKALERLKGSISRPIELKTIHSLLGWVPTINENAEHIDHIETTARLDRPIEDYTNIVIDEAGMMSEDMLYEIISKLEDKCNFDTDHITLHLFLDPYQLLPVKGKQIQVDEEFTKNLTKQWRSESPDVVQLYTKFVHYLQGINTTDLSTPYSENVLPFNIEEFKLGDRCLAYTNAQVGAWNRTIAKNLGITTWEGQEVQLGSRLDTDICERFVQPSMFELKNAYENGGLLLQNGQISKKYLESSLRAMLECPEIKYILVNGLITPVLVGTDNANNILKRAKEDAIADRSMFRYVYAYGRAFTMDYSFATTVHKSQGSEFNRVFVDKEDIQKSIFKGNYLTYARLMYVAISRSKRTIFI